MFLSGFSKVCFLIENEQIENTNDERRKNIIGSKGTSFSNKKIDNDCFCSQIV